MTTGFVAAANANQVLEWSQIQKIEKGEGIPVGISLDILGLELGDSYTEAKAKLEAIRENQPQSAGGDIKSSEKHFRLPSGGGQFVETKYTSKLTVEINHPDKNQSETIDAYFTAPSSGAQLFGINRRIWFYDHTKQPRISETLARVTEKTGAEPTNVNPGRDDIRYLYVLDDGKVVDAPLPIPSTLQCGFLGLSSLVGNFTEDTVRGINRSGDCDISQEVIFTYGVSQDHAKTMTFSLIDAERAKSNLGADFQFFADYITQLQNSGGEGPQL